MSKTKSVSCEYLKNLEVIANLSRLILNDTEIDVTGEGCDWLSEDEIELKSLLDKVEEVQSQK